MNKTALVTGHSSGLGKEITTALRGSGWRVIGVAKEGGEPDPSGVPVEDQYACDLTSPASVNSLVELMALRGLRFDAVVHCAGTNYINWFEAIELEAWDRVMNLNARAIWLLTARMISAGLLKRRQGAEEGAAIVNIVSNAAHMPMTHSAAYNASKAAAHILTLQMQRELGKRFGLTVFGLAPNKLKGTGMSEYIERAVCELRGWTPEEAAAYQLQALPAGEETDPAAVAEFLAFLLSTNQRHKYLAGCILPYGA